MIVNGNHDIREHQGADILVLATGTADRQVCVDLTFDTSTAPPGGC